MKSFKKTLSVILSLLICLSAICVGFSFTASAAESGKYVVTGNKTASIDGWHHWPNNCLGGVKLSALGAAEVSTENYSFRTNQSGTSGQVDTRVMNDNDAPIATYYVDINEPTFTVKLLCEMTDRSYAQIINYQFSADSSVKSQCSISDIGWNTQRFFVQNNNTNHTSKTFDFTGNAPTNVGEAKEYLIYYYVDIANGQTGYIHARYALKIRFVGFGASNSGKTTVTNRVHRNWPNLYCYDGIVSAYNVDGGQSSAYSNDNDGGYTANDSTFDLKSTATAFAYIDRTQYSRLEDTDISFSHKVAVLCANGVHGWSWANIFVSSDKGSFSKSLNYLEYTINNDNGNSYLENIYNLPFKVCGDLPAAGEDPTVTISGYYDANATQTGFNYNAKSNLELKLYLYDKTELNNAITNAESYIANESAYTAQSYFAFIEAYNEAVAVRDANHTQAEIETAKTELNNAISALEKIIITFDANGGTAVNPESVEIRSGEAFGTLPETSLIGHTFDGWYTEATGGTRIESTTSVPTESKTYYAHWTVNTYTITFNTNGGSAISLITQNYNTAVNAPANPTKNGYTFAGWDKIIPTTMPAENITITASWTTEPYTITYTLNGGTVATANPTSYNVETASFNLNNPTRTGYTFTGWTGTGLSTAQTSVSIAQGSTGNKSYVANWTANTYTVIFDPNGGIGTMVSQSFTYSASQALTANSYQKDGYYFAGWSTSPNGAVAYRDKQPVGNLNSAPNGEVTLYAVWNLVTEFEVEIPSYCGTVEWSTHPSLNKYKVATVTAPITNQGKYFVYWTATYSDGTTEIASTYRQYSFFATRDVSLTPVYVATESEYNYARADALVVSRVTGFNANGDGTNSLLIEHSVSPTVVGNGTSIVGHGVIYTTNELYKNDLNLENENDDVINKIARTSANNLTGLLEVNIDNASTIWAVPYVIISDSQVRYGTMKELDITSQTASFDEEIMTSGVMSFDLTSFNAGAEDLVIEETQPTVDDEFEQPTTLIGWIIKIVTTIVENLVAIIKRVEVIK